MIKAVLIRWDDSTVPDSCFEDIEAIDTSGDGRFAILQSKELTVMINIDTIRIMTIVNNINDE